MKMSGDDLPLVVPEPISVEISQAVIRTKYPHYTASRSNELDLIPSRANAYGDTNNQDKQRSSQPKTRESPSQLPPWTDPYDYTFPDGGLRPSQPKTREAARQLPPWTDPNGPSILSDDKRSNQLKKRGTSPKLLDVSATHFRHICGY